MPARAARSSAALNRRDAGIAAALAAVAAVLRLPSLGPDSLYRDDTWQALATRANGFGDLLRTGVTAPGYAALLRGWSALAGTSTTALQVPALVAGTCLPALVYLLGRRWGLSRPATAVAATLLVAGDIAVSMSARVKPFGLDAVVAVGLIWLGTRTLELPGASRRWIALVAASIGALVFSASTLPVTAGVAFVCLVVAWRAGVMRVAAPALAALGVAAAGWYVAVLAPARTGELHDFWRGNYAPLTDGVGGLRHLRVLVEAFLGYAAPEKLMSVRLLVWLLGVVAGAGAVVLVRRGRCAQAGLAGLPIVIAAGLATLELAPFGTGRTDLYLLPGLALLVAAAIDAIANARPALAPAAAVVVAAMLVAAATPALHGTYPDEDLRGAVLAADAARGPGTVTIVLPEFAYAWAFYRGGPVMVRDDERAMTGFTPLAEPDVLLLPGFQVTATGERNARLRRAAVAAVDVVVAPPEVAEAWVVRSDYYPSDDLPEVYDALRAAGFHKVPGFEHRHGIAEHWTR